MDKQPDQEKSTKTAFLFFCFGVLTIVFHETMLTAASDVLAGSSITAATGILAAGVPQVLVKLTVPWMLQTIPHICKMVIIFILFACGLIILVVSPDPAARLAGVGVAEVGTSLAEITFLSLTAFYSPVVTTAFVTGLAIGSLIGPLYYTGELINIKARNNV